jgi:hypothetical protein
MNQSKLLRNIIIIVIVIVLAFIGFALYLRFSVGGSTNSVKVSNANQPMAATPNQTQNTTANVVPSPKGKLVILKAIYGTAKKSIDVTSQLNKLITNNTLSAFASNELAGDPDFGTVKTLEIQYSVNGAKFTKTYQENEAVNLP